MKQIGSLIYFICCISTAMIGQTIHNSVFWSIMDFVFTPIAWAKWLICHEVSVSIITKTFESFLK